MRESRRRAGTVARFHRRKKGGQRSAFFSHLPGPLTDEILDDARVGVAWIDSDLNYRRVNETYARLESRTRDDYPGRNLFDLTPDPHLENAIQALLASGQPQIAYGVPYSEGATDRGPAYRDCQLHPDPAGGGMVLLLRDVTTRERALREFQQAQGLFSTLFESMPDANLLVNKDGEILAANRQAEGLFGYLRAELIGQPVEMLIPPDMAEKHVQLRTAYANNPHTREIGAGLDLHAVRKNGTRFPVDVMLTTTPTEQGPVVLCLVHDLTMRRASQRALQEQTALVRLQQEITSAANSSSSLADTIRYTLDKICAYLGWPVGHAFLRSPDDVSVPGDVWNTHFPDGMKDFREATNRISFRTGLGLVGQVVEIGQPLWMTYPQNRPNFIRRKEAQAAGINTALGVPVRVGQDVAAVLEFYSVDVVEPDADLLEALPHVGTQLGRALERRQSENALHKREAQLNTLVTNLPVILFATDPQGMLIFLEGRGLTAAGLDPANLLGHPLQKMINASPAQIETATRALKGEAVYVEVDETDGITYDMYLTPYLNKEGALQAVIGLAIDVSERKRMESELAEIRRHLMESVEVERLRLSQTIHDGPLQDLYGVYYQVQDLKNQVGVEEQAIVEKALETIQQVNNTLRFILGELRPTTLAHLGLKIAIRSHAARLQEQHPSVDLHLDLADDLQRLDPAIRLGLYRVYQGLISNVVQHSRASHAWVRLKLEPEQAILEVEDNGMGFAIPESWLELVRVGRLGLTGAQERAEAMGGKLEIQSKPGSGTLARVVVKVE